VQENIRLGVFGGSFDPPHKAHLELVKLAVEKVGLDHVLVTVANDPWQKSATRQVTDGSHRLEMTRLLFRDYSDATVTDIEFQLGGESNTAGTLRALRPNYQSAEFFLLLGYDSAIGIETWREPELILDQARVVVVDRPGFMKIELPAALSSAIHVQGLNLDISSQNIRSLLDSEESLSDTIPEVIRNYIAENGLYRE
tara:strand:- start:13179 stop:13772 length:594 start_codon:yes stop_codon:yes gene_type:complete